MSERESNIMREFIKKQLQQVSFANLSNYDAQTGTFHIPKYTKPKYELNHCYLVKLQPNIINNSTSVLATNWNNGSSPSQQYLKIFVSKILGKNIYVDSIAVNIETNQDTNIMWSGWLTMDSIEQISVLM